MLLCPRSGIARFPRMLIGGVESLALGALASGCKFYAAYPDDPLHRHHELPCGQRTGVRCCGRAGRGRDRGDQHGARRILCRRPGHDRHVRRRFRPDGGRPLPCRHDRDPARDRARSAARARQPAFPPGPSRENCSSPCLPGTANFRGSFLPPALPDRLFPDEQGLRPGGEDSRSRRSCSSIRTFPIRNGPWTGSIPPDCSTGTTGCGARTSHVCPDTNGMLLPKAAFLLSRSPVTGRTWS